MTTHQPPAGPHRSPLGLFRRPRAEWKAGRASDPTPLPAWLTADEQQALDLLDDLAVVLDRIVERGERHPSDTQALHVHQLALRTAVMGQAAARAYPGLYRRLGALLPSAEAALAADVPRHRAPRR